MKAICCSLNRGVRIGLPRVARLAVYETFPRSGGPVSRRQVTWLGLVPRQHSSGGRERLGRFSNSDQSKIRSFENT
ncbi:transposase [Limimaricola cinnabarinus]|uniref:transposase n=1 Tax=Limimaricola cinnabarinus TaxID=1125964 RepID=UPI002FE005CC